MSRTTRATVFHGVGIPFEFQSIPLPKPAPREILVEVIGCTLCGSDLHTMHGRRSVPVPTILGHEVLGRIIQFGTGAIERDAAGEAIHAGDRVTWAIVASCNACFFCTRDLPQKCLNQTKYGHEATRPGHELTGGLAGHCVLVPGTAIFRVPNALTDEVACPANCATATVAAAIEAAGPIIGRNVLVLGAGMLGVTATAWIKTLGADHVILCDNNPTRLENSAPFGATHRVALGSLSQLVNEETSGHGVDVVLELTGSAEAFESGLALTRTGGTFVAVGAVFPSRAIPIFPEQIVRRCLTLRGVHNYAPRHLKAALDFLQSAQKWPFQSLVADWQPLSALDRVLTQGIPTGALRIGIRPD